MRTSISNRLTLAIGLVMASTSVAAEPAAWKWWPFQQAAPKAIAPTNAAPQPQKQFEAPLPPVVSPAAYQPALNEAAKLTRPIEPFPLPPGAMTADELYR